MTHTDQPPFDFGRNWRAFQNRHLDEHRISAARAALTFFLGLESLEGLLFFDVGCGSGLHSLAAHRLGARVLSFDVDPGCVACCAHLREQEGSPHSWVVRQGSILDRELVTAFGTADVVYTWGVLHHTGQLAEALDNVRGLVKPDGLLYLAVYNTMDTWWRNHRDGRFGTSAFWAREKRLFNTAPKPLRWLLAVGFSGLFAASSLLQCRNPFRSARNLEGWRGMHWWTDVQDWLGGWPYETRSRKELLDWGRSAGLAVVRERCPLDLRNNEILFRLDT